MLYPENMQNYQGGEPELDVTKLIRRGLLDVGTDSGAGKVQPQMPSQEPAAQPSAIDNLLNMQRPMTPKEQSIAEHGKGGHIARSIGGFLLGDADMFTKDEYKDKYEADKARYGVVSNMKQNMPAFREYDAMMRDDDANNDSEAMYMMNKMFGADDKLMKQMYGEYGGRNPDSVMKNPTYTEGDYQLIDGEWNLVQQANDGSVKKTPMGPDFKPANRMPGADYLDGAIGQADKSYQSASDGANQARGILDQMDQIGEDGWASGLQGKGSEFYKAVTGTEDFVSTVRKNYQDVKVRSGIKNLPPGVASDKDIELALSPWPEDTSDFNFIRRKLEAIERIEKGKAEYARFESQYISDNNGRNGLQSAWSKTQAAQGVTTANKPTRKWTFED